MRKRIGLSFVFCQAAVLLVCGRHDVAASQPPSIFISSPPPNSEITTADTIQIQANASDTDGTITAVEFYVNGTLLAQDASAPYTTSWSSMGGTYDLTAVAIDDASDRATSTVVRVTVVPAGPRDLFWNTQLSTGDWNGTAFNWRANAPSGPLTIFRGGDSVNFIAAANVFIGSNGVPGSVSPALVRLLANSTFQGGDIASGSLATANTVFSNYSTSLSFPGGTLIGSYVPGLVYDVSAALQGAALQFGSGPIFFTNIGEGVFTLDERPDRAATLVNDFVTSSGNSTIAMGTFGKSNAVARFYGTLNLNGRLNVRIQNGKTSWYQGVDAESHEWLGPVILNQSSPRNLMFNLMGNYSSKGLVISGSILDGPGLSTNRLTFQDYAVPFVRLAGNNTYANGTLIGPSPSAPQAVVEVTPWSSLGTGNVEVDSSGVLRLMGNRNVASNRSVIVRGRVILEPGIKVRISSLRLGATTFTSGLFTATNGLGYLASNGTFRLPATNLLPTISLTNPPPGTVLSAGQPLVISAAVSDVDSYIQRVEFLLNGALAGTLTNTPYRLSLANPPAGEYPLQAIAYDDDGGARTSAVVTITMAPRIDRIEHSAADSIAVLEFDSTLNRACGLEATDSLSPPAWMPLTNFPPETVTRHLRVTNALPAGLSTRFYRLVLF